MSRPTVKRSSAQQRRGLRPPWKKGQSGNPRGRQPGPNKVTLEVKALCRGLVEDATYQTDVRRRLHAGKLLPAMEAMIWHYAYGKPKEQLEHSGTLTVSWLPSD